MQKCGAGLHTASSCYWDNTTDGKHIKYMYLIWSYQYLINSFAFLGSCTVKWENKSMYFIVTVFGLAI